MTDERRTVYSTSHAVVRARQRFGFKGGFPQVTKRIGWEVGEALSAGRTGVRFPHPFGRRRHGKGIRAAWNEERTRGYVYRLSEGAVLVITAYTPSASFDDEEEVAA